MFSHMRHNVVAYLALFVALGGTSYAAVKLPAKSVGTKQLKNNAVTAAKVKNGSLLKDDFKSGQLPAGARGPAGAAGVAGAPGAKGATGLQGPAGSPGAGKLVGQNTTATSNPTVLPDGSNLVEANLTLPSAGRLHVYGHAHMLGYCATSNAQVGLWLEKNDVAIAGVPGTKRVGSDDLPGGTSLDPAAVTSALVGDGTVIGAGGVVGAGAYKLMLLARCVGGEPPNGVHGSGEYTVGAVLLSP